MDAECVTQSNNKLISIHLFAREQINELTSIKEKREHAENILQAVETENQKLKETIEKLVRAKNEQEKLKQQIANIENEQKKPHDKGNPNFHNKLYKLRWIYERR
jgi:DNA repair exonuclease SbcCD ATPase subunit